MLVCSQEGLQDMMCRIKKISTEYDMTTNIKKTRLMRIGRGKERTVNITMIERNGTS